MRPRIIPVLLVEDGGLVKTIKFNKRVYLGDPINTVRLFNDMEVDELVVLDISATKNARGPNLSLIEDIRNEAFMPLAYGGGVTNASQIRDLIYMGIEKVALNNVLNHDPSIIKEASEIIGSQSIIASIDIKKTLFGQYKLFTYLDNRSKHLIIKDLFESLEDLGIGEVLLNFVDRDGTWAGYDLAFVEEIVKFIKVPLVVSGGAGSLNDLNLVTKSGADAAAAGSLFSFQGKGQGVLTNYPNSKELERIFNNDNKL